MIMGEARSGLTVSKLLSGVPAMCPGDVSDELAWGMARDLAGVVAIDSALCAIRRHLRQIPQRTLEPLGQGSAGPIIHDPALIRERAEHEPVD